MPKAVLLSIKPQYCEPIASGKKTIEVRKTRPKLQPLFKCYIYCTQGDKLWVTTERERFFCNGKVASIINAKDVGGCYLGNSKVIGEFVCDFVNEYTAEFVDDYCYEDIRQVFRESDGDSGEVIITSNEDDNPSNCYLCTASCLSFGEIKKYIGVNFYEKPFYGWHISDLKIYETPKELGEFWKAGKCPYASENGCTYEYYCFRAGQTNRCGETLTCPPQSWCYVENE